MSETIPMSGMILPAGSPLVQFEMRALAHGAKTGKTQLPIKLWVDRTPIKPLGHYFVCGGPVFRISSAVGVKVNNRDEGPCVCKCMGGFIE